MNYQTATDREVNAAVHRKLGLEVTFSSGDKVGGGEHPIRNRDYFNNPADMMPIVFELGIGLMPSVGGGWAAMHGGLNGSIAHNENPLRAVAECYLMMGDEQ